MRITVKCFLIFILAYNGIANGQSFPNLEEKFVKYALTEIATHVEDSEKYSLIKFDRDLSSNEIAIINPKRQFSLNHFIVNTQFLPIITPKILYKIKANSLWKASDNLILKWERCKDRTEFLKIRLVFENELIGSPKYLNSYQPQAIDNVYKIITISVPIGDLVSILNHQEIIFADIIPMAKQEAIIDELDLPGIEVSAIHQLMPNVDGRNIVISLKDEQFDPNDIDFLGKVTDKTFNARSISDHATKMATLALGSGNSFIKGRGVAPGALLCTSDFKNLMPDDIDKLAGNNVSIQNHSYGTEIENIYGIEATAYDKQVFEVDTLMHVFSAGNKGIYKSLSGVYGNVPNAANITGNLKQAKNILVVGLINQENNVDRLSSRGPAYDGRVKPDLVANGENGTSGSAALTSGVVALLQQEYHGLFAKPAPFAVIKSILINSADDLGRLNVDYAYGFGKVNALNAIKTLVENRFETSEISENQDFIFPISVEANQTNLKITLVWNDPPASINSIKSIVNHLDLSLETPNGEIILPWVLNSYPHQDSLLQPAVRKRDELNTVQQVSLENLLPGRYIVHVRGRKVIQAIQKFALAYQLNNSDQFNWTYPESNDYIFANQNNYVRWNSSFYHKKGKIYLSYDNGITWELLNSSVDLNNNFFKLKVSNVFTKAMLKMEVDGKVFKSKPFMVSNSPELNVGYNCEDNILFHWKVQPSASSYTLYNIKDNKLSAIANSTDTLILISKSNISSPYFALSTNGKDFNGLKGYTIDYRNQGIDCYIRSFTAEIENTTIQLNLKLGSTFDLDTIIWEKEVGPNIFDPIYTENANGTRLTYNFIETKPKIGIQRYRVVFIKKSGSKIYSEILPVTFLGKDDFLIFPNPVNTELFITGGSSEEYNLQMYNVIGQKIFDKRLQGNKQIDVSKFISGYYICLIIKNGIIIKTSKVVKL